MKALISFLILVPLSFGCGERDEVDSNRGSLEAPVWIRTPGTDQALGIARFADEGSLVLTGRTDGGLGEDDGFVSLISADGELQWMTILGSAGVDVLLDVDVHASGTIFAGGVSTGDFQGERNALFSDGALSALDTNGVVLWSRLLGMGAINQLTLEDDGVVVSGSGIQPGRQDADAFIAKYSLSGERLWSTWVSSDGTDSATGLFIQDNTIWVVGFTDGALFFEGTTVSLDGWIGRFDREGRLLEGEQVDANQDESFTRICALSDGGLVVAGYTSDSDGNIDGTLRRYDASHSEFHEWRSQWVGSDAIYGLVCTADDKVVVSGRIDVASNSDGFRASLDDTLREEEIVISAYPGRDEWVDLVDTPEAICYAGYRPFDANQGIDDLDAVAECY